MSRIQRKFFSLSHLFSGMYRSPKEDRSIAVVGAGMAGLMCARVLQMNNVPVTIYERDESPTFREQGGSLDMDPHMGYKSIQMANLEGEFKKVMRPEGEAMRIIDPHGKVWMDDNGRDEKGEYKMYKPEVDRSKLRNMLLSSLKEGTIKWGSSVKSVAPTSENTAILTFANDATPKATHDFVVGADGAWSRIRRVVSSSTPSYSGVSFIDVFLTDVDNKYPSLSQFFGQGISFVLGNNLAIIPQRNSNSVVRAYIAFRQDQSWFDQNGLKAATENGDFSKVYDLLLQEFKEWTSPDILEFFKATLTCESMTFRPLFTFQEKHAWTSNPQTTLIGDAAHVMVVFSGDGANNAMLDGAELGEIVSKHIKDPKPSWDQAIKAFEESMQARAWQSTFEALRNMNFFISDSDESAQRTAELMKKIKQGRHP